MATVFHDCGFEHVFENGTTQLSGGTNNPKVAFAKMQEHARALFRQGKSGQVHLICGNPPRPVGCVVVSELARPCGWNEDDRDTGWLCLDPNNFSDE
jgi:hypothetical protein